MPSLPYRIAPLGDRGIVIELGNQIDMATFQRVQAVLRRFDQRWPEGSVELVPAFTSVTLYYDPLRRSWAEVCECVEQLLSDVPRAEVESRRVEVPVSYGGEQGPDLEFVARHTGLSASEVIAIHSGTDYLVHMIGFAPGFPYLGGMSPRIAVPRRTSPRLKTPAGSVGIAGEQTGIYPLETPGGWQIIGRTPLALFRPAENPPTLLQAGDLVRFLPITAAQFSSSQFAGAHS